MKDEIVKLLKKCYEPLELIQINDLLNLKTPEELTELIKTLVELENEYLVYKTRKDKYVLLEYMNNIKVGRLAITEKGFGFVLLPKEEDIRIEKENLNGAIHDDIVLCEIISKTFKKEGRVLKIVKRELNNLVGEIVEEDHKLYLKLDDVKKDITVVLDEDSTKNCVPGHKVLVAITKEITNRRYKGKVITIIGHKTDPGVDILSIAYKYGILEEFPDEVNEEIENIPTEVKKSELKGRIDLTAKQIFTIDGDDTKDIDDAISLEMDKDDYILGVHIADVSYYVKKDTPLGNEAFKRGTSSYLADTVIPMLPRKLSNGICSLNPNEARLTLSCEMRIDKKGNILDTKIFESYIKSNIQMTYKKVNDILMRNICQDEYLPFKDTLLKMNELAHILRANKVHRGYIDFDLDEAKIIQNSEGKAIGVEKRIREDGEKLIEDFMIAANESIATYISNMELPFIYRVHENPDSEKIDRFLNLIKVLGYKLKNKARDFSNKNLQQLLEELKEKKEFGVLSALLLRSMKKAVYQTNNVGHFGLASKKYTHFTSPIRRFPDLQVHRLIRTYLFLNDLSITTIQNIEQELDFIAEHSSVMEQASEKAERDVFDMKAAEYMEGHIGEEFTGTIDTVANYGFYVELDNLIEGLVHISSIKGDYYIYVEELLCLIGQKTKKTYRLGDKIKVKLVGASKESSLIDFEIVTGDKNGNKE